MAKKCISILLCCLYTQANTAQIFDKSVPANPPGNEFFVGREYGKPLIKINLISGVQRPGVYHVPTDSDLTEVIAYAGGAHEKANLSDIVLVRQTQNKRSTIEVDLDRYLSRPEGVILVADQDTIHIPVDRSMDRTLNWVAIISGLASIALAVSVIDTQNKAR